MRMLLVSNDSLAKDLYEAMGTFYRSPEISYIEMTADLKEKNVSWLRKYLLESDEETILLCDRYDSVAYCEIVKHIQELCKWENMILICGMSLAMVFKIYGLKDHQNLELIKFSYKDMEDDGIYVFERNEIYIKKASA